MKAGSHSGFLPVSSRSRKVRLNTGVMMPSSEEMVAVSTTNTVAMPVPFSRSLA